MYEYFSHVLRTIDGDTLWADVDLGCDTHLHLTIRLAGVNAPESGSVEGQAATEYVENWIHNHGGDGGLVLLRTTKDRREKYGRYLGDVFGWPEGIEERFKAGMTPDRHLNEMLVVEGHAVPYDGGHR